MGDKDDVGMSVVGGSRGASAWTQDGAGHPIYLQGDDLDAARDEWLARERRVDSEFLHTGAIASSVSRGREYGQRNLEKLAEMIDKHYKVVHDRKQVYERIAALEISGRSEILGKLKRGQTNFTKLLVCSPIADDRTFIATAAKLRGDGRPLTATQIRQEATHIKEAQRAGVLSATAQANPLLPWLMPGEYRTLVVDPPWFMRTAHFRPYSRRSVEWPYSHLTEADLAVVEPMLELPGKQCHLYLWTTHRHLEMALRLVDVWGFRYQCVMTWIKGRGMTPNSWHYDTELVLFAHRGGLPLQRVGLPLHFYGKAREHSRKPEEFYEIVRQASPEPRIDVFSREDHEGFDSWGDQAGHFSDQPRIPLLENW